jgi:hypothetical protein
MNGPSEEIKEVSSSGLAEAATDTGPDIATVGPARSQAVQRGIRASFDRRRLQAGRRDELSCPLPMRRG